MYKLYSDIDKHFSKHNTKNLYDDNKLYAEISVNNIMDKININDNIEILELGCGDGIVSYKLAEKYKHCKFICVDGSNDNIKYARCYNNSENIEYITSNFLNLPDYICNKKFGLIMSFNSMQYVTTDDFITLNKKLLYLLDNNGVVFHFSLPDVRKRIATLFATYYRNNKFSNLCNILINILRNDEICKYEADGLSFWHYPKKIINELNNHFNITISSNKDIWYRFDISLIPKR